MAGDGPDDGGDGSGTGCPGEGKQTLFQQFGKIAPPVGNDMDVNLMGGFIDLIDDPVRSDLDFPERGDADPFKFRGYAAAVREFSQTVTHRAEFFQNGFCGVQPVPLGNKRQKCRPGLLQRGV